MPHTPKLMSVLYSMTAGKPYLLSRGWPSLLLFAATFLLFLVLFSTLQC
jgi:hypothetical protein